MTWIDRALATLSPADVAERIDSAVLGASERENYAALRRALPRMTSIDLAQLSMAFDVPLQRHESDAAPEMLFDPEERASAVLAHFLTVPDEMNVRLAAFLRGHPRALAYFDAPDAERLLMLEQTPRRSIPIPAIAALGAVAAALGFGLVRVLHL